MVLPKEVLMDAIGGGLAGSPTGPIVGGGGTGSGGGAPQRRTEIF